MKWFPDRNVPKKGWTPISRGGFVFSGWKRMVLPVLVGGALFCGYFAAKTEDDFLVNKLLIFGGPPVMFTVLMLFRRDPRAFPVVEEQEMPTAGDGASPKTE
ncbi:MAG TPA: hypothetical protein VM186_11160 [Planctomycetota bacterium]|nr:hypothetical protein [Planctomycetota bacterium]